MINWLIGFILGLLGGVFFAPASGKTFRSKLFNPSGHIKKGAAKEFGEEFKDLAEDIANTASEFYDRKDVQKALKTGKDTLMDGVELTEEKSKEALVYMQKQMNKLGKLAMTKATELEKSFVAKKAMKPMMTKKAPTKKSTTSTKKKAPTKKVAKKK